MKKLKRYFAVLLSVLMIVSSVPVTVYAQFGTATWEEVGSQNFTTDTLDTDDFYPVDAAVDYTGGWSSLRYYCYWNTGGSDHTYDYYFTDGGDFTWEVGYWTDQYDSEVSSSNYAFRTTLVADYDCYEDYTGEHDNSETYGSYMFDTWDVENDDGSYSTSYFYNSSLSEDGLYADDGYIALVSDNIPIADSEAFKIEMDFSIKQTGTDDVLSSSTLDDFSFLALTTESGHQTEFDFDDSEGNFVVHQMTSGECYVSNSEDDDENPWTTTLVENTSEDYFLTSSNPTLELDTDYTYVLSYYNDTLRAYVKNADGDVVLYLFAASVYIDTSKIGGLVIGDDDNAYYDSTTCVKEIRFYTSEETGSNYTLIDDDEDAYVLAFFTGNDDETLHLAVSDDGYNFEALNANDAVWTEDDFTGDEVVYPTGLSDEYYGIDVSGHIRDPFIFEAEDGSWYILATNLDTDGGSNFSNNSKLVVWHMSELGDLSNAEVWFIDTQAIMYDYFTELGTSTTVLRGWAPEAIWDEEEQAYMLFFAVANSSWYSETGAGTIMYYVYTTDFQTFTDPEILLPSASGDTIDGNITRIDDDEYVLWYKDESNSQIMVCTAQHASGPYSEPIYMDFEAELEGPEIYQIAEDGTYILMADVYGHTQDLDGDGEEEPIPFMVTFSCNTPYATTQMKYRGVNLNYLNVRHGSVANCTTEEMNNLIDAYSRGAYDISTIDDDEDVNDYLVAQYFTTADPAYDATGNGYNLDYADDVQMELTDDGTPYALFTGSTSASDGSSADYDTNNYTYAYVETAEMAEDYDFNVTDGITITWEGYSTAETEGRWFDWMNIYDSDSGSYLNGESTAGQVVWDGDTYNQNTITNLYCSSAFEFGYYDVNSNINIYSDNKNEGYGSDGEWHTYTITVAGGYIAYWIDGVIFEYEYYYTSSEGTIGDVYQIGAPQQTADMEDSFFEAILNGVLYFGASAWGADSMLNGGISNFRIYSKALNQADLEASLAGIEEIVPNDLITGTTTNENGKEVEFDYTEDYIFYDSFGEVTDEDEGTVESDYDNAVYDAVCGAVLDISYENDQIMSTSTYYGSTSSDNSTTNDDTHEGYTISFWYEATGNDDSQIFELNTSDTPVLTLTEGALSFEYFSTDWEIDAFGDYEFTEGEWGYITIQIEENNGYDTIYVYVDGQLVSKTGTYTDSSIGTVEVANSAFVYMTDEDADVYYGTSASGTTACIDEFTIYDDIYSAESLYRVQCENLATSLVVISAKKYANAMAQLADYDEETGTYTSNGYMYTNMAAAYEAYDAIQRYYDSINFGTGAWTEQIDQVVELYFALLEAINEMEEYTEPESYESLNVNQTNVTTSVSSEYTNGLISSIDLSRMNETEGGTDNDYFSVALSSTSFVWLYTGDGDTLTAPVNLGGRNTGTTSYYISSFSIADEITHTNLVPLEGDTTTDYHNEGAYDDLTPVYTVDSVDLSTQSTTTVDLTSTDPSDGYTITFDYTASGNDQVIFTIGNDCSEESTRCYLTLTEDGALYFVWFQGTYNSNYYDFSGVFGDVSLSSGTTYEISLRFKENSAGYTTVHVYVDGEWVYTLALDSTSAEHLESDYTICDYLASEEWTIYWGSNPIYWTASSGGSISDFNIYSACYENDSETVSFATDFWGNGTTTNGSLDWNDDPDSCSYSIPVEYTSGNSTFGLTKSVWTLASNYFVLNADFTVDDGYLITVKPAFEAVMYWESTFSSGTNDNFNMGLTGTINIINYVPVEEALFADTFMEILCNITDYVSDGVIELLNAYDALTSQSYYTSSLKAYDLACSLKEMVEDLQAVDLKEIETSKKADTTEMDEAKAATASVIEASCDKATESTSTTDTATVNGTAYDVSAGYTTDSDGNTYNYTTSSWEAFISAYNAIEDYYDSLNPYGDNNSYLTTSDEDQAIITSYAKNLIAAANALVVKADFSVVNAIAEESEGTTVTVNESTGKVTVTYSTGVSAQTVAYYEGLGANYSQQKLSVSSFDFYVDDYEYILQLAAMDQDDIPMININYTAGTTGPYIGIDADGNVVCVDNPTDYFYCTYVGEFYENEGDDSATLDESGNWIYYEGEWYDVTNYRYSYTGVSETDGVLDYGDMDYSTYSNVQVAIYESVYSVLGDGDVDSFTSAENAEVEGTSESVQDVSEASPTVAVLVTDDSGNVETGEDGNIVKYSATVTGSTNTDYTNAINEITSSYTALESVDCKEGYEAYDKAWSYFEKIDPDAYVSEEVLERYGSTDGGYYTYEDGKLVVADDEEATIGSGAVYVEYESNVTGKTGTYYYTSSITSDTTSNPKSTDYYTYRILSFLGGYEIDEDNSISTVDYSSYQTYTLKFEVYVDGTLDENLGLTKTYQSGTSVTLTAPTESETETDDDGNAVTYTVAAWSRTVDGTTSALAGLDSSYTLAVTKNTTVAVYVTSSTCETIEVTYADAVNAKYQVVYVANGTTYKVDSDGTITFTTDGETVATLSHTLPSYYTYSNVTVSDTEVTSGTIEETTTFVANGEVSDSMVYYVIDAGGAGDTVSISNSTSSTATVTSDAVTNGSDSYSYAYTTAVLDDVVTVTVGGEVDDCGEFLGIAMYYDGAFYMVSYSNTVTLYAFDVANGFGISDSDQIYTDLKMGNTDIESGANVVAFIPVYEEFFEDEDYSSGELEISCNQSLKYSINYETVGSAKTVIPQIVSVGVYDSADSIFNVYCNVTQGAEDATIVEKGILYSRTANEDDTLVKDGTGVSVAKDGSALTETNYSFSISVSNNATYGTTLYVRGYVSYQITVSEYTTASGTEDGYEDDTADSFTMTLISYSNIVCTDDC